MAKNVLAVYDPCQGYVERFLKYAAEKSDLNFEFCGFTDPAALEAKLSDGRVKAVLLSREENDKGGYEKISGLLTDIIRDDSMVIMMLGEQPDSACSEEKAKFIYKYQPARNLFDQIREIIAQSSLSKADSGTERELRLSGIYAPWDKAAHPEIAVKIAQIVRNQEPNGSVRLLYINLEPFSGMRTLLELPENSGLSDVIYYYRTRPEQLGAAVRKAAGRFRDMDILTAPDNLDDLEEIKKEEWPDFLEAISRAGDYQNIILDISVMTNQLENMVFQYGSLYIPALPYGMDGPAADSHSELRQNKLKEYREYLKRARNRKELERVYEIRRNADR